MTDEVSTTIELLAVLERLDDLIRTKCSGHCEMSSCRYDKVIEARNAVEEALGYE